MTFHGRGTGTVKSGRTHRSGPLYRTAASSGLVPVSVGGVASTGSINFTVPAPQVTSITHRTGDDGTQVTVTGANFQKPRGGNILFFPGNSGFAALRLSSGMIHKS